MQSPLGISFIGWFLIGLVYVPVSLVLLMLVIGRWRSQPRKAAVIALLVYTPLVAAVAEAVYVDMRFKALCATGGTQIKQRVVVEGFYDAEFRRETWETFLRTGENGYRFVEWRDEGGRVWRSERVDPGEVRRLPLDKPTARYHWRNPEFASPYGHLVKRREETITDSATGEVIARRVMGYRYPAFVDRLWARFMGGGPEICSSNDILSRTLVGIDRKEN
jgi:hypothetical protein